MTCIKITGTAAMADLTITVDAPDRVAAIRAVRTMQKTPFTVVTRVTVDGTEVSLGDLLTRARIEEANLRRGREKVCPMCGNIAISPDSHRRTVCHNCGFTYPGGVIEA